MENLLAEMGSACLCGHNVKLPEVQEVDESVWRFVGYVIRKGEGANDERYSEEIYKRLKEAWLPIFLCQYGFALADWDQETYIRIYWSRFVKQMLWQNTVFDREAIQQWVDWYGKRELAATNHESRSGNR